MATEKKASTSSLCLLKGFYGRPVFLGVLYSYGFLYSLAFSL